MGQMIPEAQSDLVSIIVPVFNTEVLLRKCLASLITQTHARLEIILINDGSTDQSAAICDEFAAEDSRFRVFHLSNGGVARARNFGLSKATGDFISFVDSDDLISPIYIETLLHGMKEGVDVTCCGYEEVSESTAIVPKVINHEPTFTTYSSQQALSLLFYQRQISSSPWSKLFRTELLSSIRFPEEMRIGEDLVFLVAAFGTAETITVTQERTYYYLWHSANASSTSTLGTRLPVVDYLQQIGEEYELDGQDLAKSVFTRLFSELTVFFSSRSSKLVYPHLWSKIQNLRTMVLTNSQAHTNLRVLAGGAHFGPTIFRSLLQGRLILGNFVRKIGAMRHRGFWPKDGRGS